MDGMLYVATVCGFSGRSTKDTHVEFGYALSASSQRGAAFSNENVLYTNKVGLGF
jgi:hypothetical protein